MFSKYILVFIISSESVKGEDLCGFIHILLSPSFWGYFWVSVYSVQMKLTHISSYFKLFFSLSTHKPHESFSLEQRNCGRRNIGSSDVGTRRHWVVLFGNPPTSTSFQAIFSLLYWLSSFSHIIFTRSLINQSCYLAEKEMTTHSSILAWWILGTEEPGGLLSIGLHRVRHDWIDLACIHVCYLEL